MRGQYGSAAVAAIEITGTSVPSREQKCPRKFGVVAKALWPRKTAQEIAYRCEVSERAAKYWLSGEREPSCAALLAIMDEIVRK